MIDNGKFLIQDKENKMTMGEFYVKSLYVVKAKIIRK